MVRERGADVKENRRLEVLRAIVSQYVEKGEPVSSKTVAEAASLSVSSATIRNDMSALEEQGLIRQPHISAGRIPTEAGYRVYVDFLPLPTPPSKRHGEALRRVLDEADDLEDAVSRAVRFLSQLTRQTAVVEYPQITSTTVRLIELVDLEASRLLVILVTSSAEVSERQIEVDTSGGLAESTVAALKGALNEALVGLPLGDVPEQAGLFVEANEERFGDLAKAVADVVSDMALPPEGSRIVTAGAAHLARSGIDFSDVAQVLDVLEDQAVLLRVLNEVHTDQIQVSIGQENKHEQLAETSLVSARYLAPTRFGTHLGIIGPTRMDYARALGAVEAVSNYLETLLVEQYGLKRSGFDGDGPPDLSDVKRN